MEMPIVKREHIDELMRLLSCKEGTMEDRLAISEIVNPIKRENPDLHQLFHEGPVVTEASTYCYFLLRKANEKPIPFIPRASIDKIIREYYRLDLDAKFVDIEKNNLEFARYISHLTVTTKQGYGDTIAMHSMVDCIQLYFFIETLA